MFYSLLITTDIFHFFCHRHLHVLSEPSSLLTCSQKKKNLLHAPGALLTLIYFLQLLRLPLLPGLKSPCAPGITLSDPSSSRLTPSSPTSLLPRLNSLSTATVNFKPSFRLPLTLIPPWVPPLANHPKDRTLSPRPDQHPHLSVLHRHLHLPPCLLLLPLYLLLLCPRRFSHVTARRLTNGGLSTLPSSPID